MFIGHFAVAFATKSKAQKISLGTLFMSAQFVDLLWPLFLLLGIEHVRIVPGNTAMTPLDFYDYPVSHSLAGCLLWSVVLGGLYFALRRDRRNAIVVGLVVFSHWILDLVVHRPDLPLAFGGGPYFGFGLWNYPAATLLIEMAMYVGGIVLYAKATAPKDRIGSRGLWVLVALLGVIYLANVLGPPPPDVEAIAIAGNAGWLIVLWAYWVDKHRRPRDAGSPSLSHQG
jgi:hypothetical protein